MNITITPGKLRGTVAAIPSKSQAHRLLICAAFANAPTELFCPQVNRDIEATAACLSALGAAIVRTADGYRVEPITVIPKKAVLPCGESGSTLRFFLPIAGALGVETTFLMEGRLPHRPLSPLWEEMERMGCRLSRPEETSLLCERKLRPGAYSIDGGVSSQFITGLLFALPLLEGDSRLTVTGKTESRPYIDMTLSALKAFGLSVSEDANNYLIRPRRFVSPGRVHVEGDWSNAAFWLAARALGSGLTVSKLNPDSPQGDRAAADCLTRLENNAVIDASNIPDLVPVLAVAAAAKKGGCFINAGRLRLKETDRLQTTAALINNLGGHADICEDALIVAGTGLKGGTVDATGDHRIAMAAAVAATVCTDPVTVLGAESVEKSYPAFWQDYKMLGGQL